MTRHDVIVVGGRCAGAATAMLLARAGLDVLVVDRAAFPSEIPHGHLIHRHGPRRLAEWGLLDEVLESGCPPVSTVTQNLGDFPLTARDLWFDDVPWAVAPRRGVLDHILLRAAAAAGAEVRERFAVLDHVWDRDRLAGIRGRAAHGRTVEERAAIVVGADGRSSQLARAVGARMTAFVPTLTCWFFAYFGEAPVEGLEMDVRDHRVVFAFPTNHGLTGVFVAWPRAELPALKAALDSRFAAALSAVPGLGERILAGRRETRFMGATQLPNFIRKPYGAGWALVGDAGVHKDPFLALGVADAFRDAQLLTDAIIDGLSGRVPLEEALSGYEHRRDEATREDFGRNIAAAQFVPPPPEIYALRAAARDDAAVARRYYMDLGRLAERVSTPAARVEPA